MGDQCLVSPLADNLAKLSTISQGKAQKSQTPQARLAKPLSVAFQSTGVLSRRNRQRVNSHFTPETPVKRRAGFVDPTATPVRSQRQAFTAHSMPNFQRAQETPESKRLITAESPDDSPVESLRRVDMLQILKPSPTVRKTKFRSPLKESPTKLNKKLHLAGHFASPIAPRSPISHMYQYRSPHRELTSDPSEASSYRDRTSSVDIHDIENEFLSFEPPQTEDVFKAPLKQAIYHPLNQHIPYSVIFSRHVLFLDQVFFDAAKGNKLALEQLLSRCERSVPSSERVPDYFEEEFRVISQLGEGTFGHVYHVKSHTDGAEYALKKTRKPFLGYRDGLLKMSEVEMLLKIGSNPWCVQLVNAWVQSGYIYMQMELCPGGNLSTMLDNYCRDFDKPLPEETVWKAFADICLGLQHIHDHNVVHLDIKPENIFVGSNGTFKIGDFGMATKLPVGDFDKEGDRVYLAPEVLAHQQIDYCADIFSLGLLVLEMASNIELPDNGLIWKQLRTGPLDELIPSSISASLRDLIKCMLHPDPHSRPSSFALLQHPILRSFVSHQVEPNLISSHSSSTSIS